jgi:hypothetical protein
MPSRCALRRVIARLIATAGATAWTAAPAASEPMQWQLAYNQETRYSSWQGTLGYPAGTMLTPARGSGWQSYTPATLGVTGVQPDLFKFEFVGRGGYVHSKQTTPGASGSVSTFVDTVVAATWTYLGIPGIQPFVSLNANLPTGTSVLLGNDTFARMDPDLVDVATFGEGWNYGVTGGVTVALSQNLAFSLGAGHTVRGNYDREALAGVPGGIADVRVAPGDVTTINAALGFRSGPLTGRLAAAYSFEGETSFAGAPSFQPGDRYFVSGSGSFTWSESSVSSLVASWSYAQKNKGIIPPFGEEALNSNSNVYRVRLEHAFIFGNWSVGPVGSWLLRDENSYSPVVLQFVPAKTRWSAGGNVRYRINEHTLLYANAEHIWIRENARIDGGAGPIPALSYTGWAVTGGASFRY